MKGSSGYIASRTRSRTVSKNPENNAAQHDSDPIDSDSSDGGGVEKITEEEFLKWRTIRDEEAKRDKWKMVEFGEGSCSIPQHPVFVNKSDQCRELLDSVLDFDDGENIGGDINEPKKDENTLPLKFKFEDEVPKPAEETEYDLLPDSKGKEKLFEREDDSKCGMWDDTEEDIIEIAKKKGMIFPRPRWWPPEGDKYW